MTPALCADKPWQSRSVRLQGEDLPPNPKGHIVVLQNKIGASMKSAIFLIPVAAFALGQPRFIDDTARSGSFALVGAAIFVDSADWPGVIRAASDLRSDIGKVTGITPDLATAQ